MLQTLNIRKNPLKKVWAGKLRLFFLFYIGKP